MRTNTLFETVNDYELALCLTLNRSCNLPSIVYFFRVISRLGNGVFWYSLIMTLPITFGVSAWLASLQMTIVGLVNLTIYKTLKPRLVRNRPYIETNNIQLHAKPLDEFSFPSGHTLHAFSFSIIACTYFPELCWVLIPFTIAVTLSRVILGLHYPTDVAAGAILGTGMALVSFQFV